MTNTTTPAVRGKEEKEMRFLPPHFVDGRFQAGSAILVTKPVRIQRKRTKGGGEWEELRKSVRYIPLQGNFYLWNKEETDRFIAKAREQARKEFAEKLRARNEQWKVFCDERMREAFEAGRKEGVESVLKVVEGEGSWIAKRIRQGYGLKEGEGVNKG